MRNLARCIEWLNSLTSEVQLLVADQLIIHQYSNRTLSKILPIAIIAFPAAS